jgi:2-polyprenyl-3-methyl-5-hydroxy-6-metoxy-1,4-benzoquinol methylase
VGDSAVAGLSEVPEDAGMKSYWDSHYKHLTEDTAFGPGSDLYRQYEYYLGLIGAPATDAHIVDLGCSVGHFLQVWHDRGFRHLHGVDMDGKSVAIARQRRPEVTFHDQNLMDWLAGNHQQYDVISLLSILEHLSAADGISVLRQLAKIVRPGGRIFVKVPNAGTIYANHWQSDDYTHRTPYTVRSLAQLCRKVGFADEQLRFFNDHSFVGGRAGWLRRALLSSCSLLDRLLLGPSVNNRFQYPVLLCVIDL